MEKIPDNFSPNQDEKIITPDVVEEGLRRMREEEAKKVADTFDALRPRRDFLDERFFKRERRRTKEAYSDNPAGEREGIRSIHHERYLQSGAKLFHVTEDVARSNMFITGDELCKAVKERFKKDRLPMSKDQDTMLKYAAEIWDEDGMEIRDYLTNLFKDYQLPLTGNKDFSVPDIVDYKNQADLARLNSLVNNDNELKRKVISDLGDNIKFEGDKDELSPEEVRHNLDSIEIDFSSFYPLILVKVKDEKLWKLSAGDARGFYSPIGRFESLGIYISDEADEAENVKKIEHEFQHGVRHRFFNRIKNRLILEKIASSRKGVIASLKEIEDLVGSMYDAKKYSEMVAIRYKKETFGEHDDVVGKIRDRVTWYIDTVPGKYRDFWHTAQDEFCSFLEGDKGDGWVGHLGSFVTGEIYSDIHKRKLISRAEIVDFDILHDMVLFYINAGFKREEIADIIRTSKDFKIAQKRIEYNFRLDARRVKEALGPSKSFSYKNMMKVLDITEKYDQTDYLFDNIDEKRIQKLVHSLLIGSKQEGMSGREITEYSRLNNEENAYEAFVRLFRLYVEKEIPKRQMAEDDSLANRTFQALNIAVGYLTKIIKPRLDLLKTLDPYPEIIQIIILRRLEKRINGDLLDGKAAQEIGRSINDELRSMQELGDLKGMKDSLMFKFDYNILEKWLDLPSEKRKEFVDFAAGLVKKHPASPINTPYLLWQFIEKEGGS